MGSAALARAVHGELIPRLAQAHRPALARLGARDVALFTADLVHGDEASLLARLDNLRRQGFSARTLCIDLLGPVARRLGALWDDDRCDFTTVSMGAGQVQRLVHQLATDFNPVRGQLVSPPSLAWPSRQLLLAQSPAEQHSLGVSMVAHFFLAAGWSVAGGVSHPGPEPSTRVQQHHIDVVGFSIGSESQLEWARRQITAVRRGTRNPRLLVMVGGPLLSVQPGLGRELGADLCVSAGQDAPALAEQALRQAATTS